MAGQPPTITDASVTLTWGPAGQYYGYATLADVGYEFANLETFTTLSSSVIAQEITYAANEMQKQLELYYVMPYAGADWSILATLRELNAKLAAARLVDRYFMASEPDLSPFAATLRNWVELKILDVVNGTEHWEYPFGDATAQAAQPVYDLSQGATVAPNPGSADPATALPTFQRGLNRYRPDSW